MTDAAHKAVFGHDVEFDKDGKPIEKGLGNLKQQAAAQTVAQHTPEAEYPADAEDDAHDDREDD